jgi:Zn-dependent M32 family carboxypeptidase
MTVAVQAKHKSGKPSQFTRRKVESLSTKVERLQWRRNKVLELSSQGRSQPEIATILQVGLGTVSRDIQYREQARKNLETHINDRLPEEYQSCMTGLKQVLKLSWDIANKSKNNSNNDNGQTTTTTITDDKTRIQALALANDCYKYIMDLATNGVVITDAIKFVQTNKEKLTAVSTEEDDKKSEDKEELEERQEKEAGEQETINHVF